MTSCRLSLCVFVGITLFILSGCQGIQWAFEADKPRPDLLATDFPEDDTVILHRTHKLDVGRRRTFWHTHTVAKVLTEQGVDNLSRVAFTLDDKRELVDFAARVIRPDGEIQEIDLASALEETTTDVTNTMSIRRIKLRLPGVEAGSLVEIGWTLEYAFSLSSISTQIADDIAPIQKYDMSIRVHRSIPFQVRTYHTKTPAKVKHEAQHTVMSFHAENIPKSSQEDYSPDSSMRDPFWKFASVPIDGVPKWERAVRFTAERLYDDKETLVGTFRTPLATTKNKCSTRDCLIDKAIDYVRETTDLVSGGSIYTMFPLARVVARGNASAFEKAMLLRQALVDLNVNADFALATKLYTQPTDETFPSTDWFNHVLVVATDSSGARVAIDPSCERCSRGELPDQTRGGRALLLDFDKNRDPALKTSFIVAKGVAGDGDVIEEHLVVKINRKGDAKYTLKREWQGEAAAREYKKTRSLSRTQLWGRGVRLARTHVKGAATSKVEYEPYAKREGRMSANVRFWSKGYGVVDGDWLIVPLSLVLPAYGRQIQKTTKEGRMGDFFFSEHVVRSETVEFVIPKGFKVLTLPAPISEKGPAFSALTTWTSEEKRVVLKRQLKIRRGRYARADFENVMRPMLEYVGSARDVIVFERLPKAQKATMSIEKRAPPTKATVDR